MRVQKFDADSAFRFVSQMKLTWIPNIRMITLFTHAIYIWMPNKDVFLFHALPAWLVLFKLCILICSPMHMICWSIWFRISKVRIHMMYPYYVAKLAHSHIIYAFPACICSAMYIYIYMCVCVCVCMRLCMCVHVCVNYQPSLI